MKNTVNEAQEKDTVRYTMFLTPAARAKILQITEQYQLSQVEAVEIILTNLDISSIDAQLKAARVNKVSNRTSKSAILAKLKNLSAEQLVALANMAPASDTEV